MAAALKDAELKLNEAKEKEKDVENLLKKVLQMKNEQLTSNGGNDFTKSQNNYTLNRPQKSIIFCAKSSSGYDKTDTTITYENSEIFNITQKDFNYKTGIFKAPITGIYHFYFTGIYIRIYLQFIT